MGLFDELWKGVPAPAPEIKPDTPHYEALGRFITSYATAETAVHLLARHLSGLSDEKARVVFGGMRLPDLVDIIRQFMRIDNLAPSDQDEIDACLAQLVLVSKKRHSLVHRSTVYFDGKLAVSNVLTSKRMHSSEHEMFTTSELSDMQLDCGCIYLRLDYVINPEVQDDSLLRQSLLKQPWRHKHVPPKTPNLKPRAKSAKQPPQPPASDGKPEDGE